MDERARRIGLNEALFRQVNEQIESLNRSLAEISDEKMHIVCECGNLDCAEQIVVGIPDYERIRADATLFFVLPGHELPSVEVVVEEADGFNVVCKHAGDPARVAQATNPREP
jgi:hypothetical protein